MSDDQQLQTFGAIITKTIAQNSAADVAFNRLVIHRKRGDRIKFFLANRLFHFATGPPPIADLVFGRQEDFIESARKPLHALTVAIFFYTKKQGHQSVMLSPAEL